MKYEKVPNKVFISFQCDGDVAGRRHVEISSYLLYMVVSGVFPIYCYARDHTKDSRTSLNKGICMEVLEYCHLVYCEFNARDYNALLYGWKLQIAGIEIIIERNR